MKAWIFAYFVVGIVVAWDFMTEPARKAAHSKPKYKEDLTALIVLCMAKVLFSVLMSPFWPLLLLMEFKTWREKNK